MTSTVDNAGNPATFSFSAENVKRIEEIIAKYPAGKQASACMPLLDLAQRQNDGWISVPVMDHIAEVLGMVPIQVYEVATFYTMYNLKPVGQHHVQVCTNLPCWLRGSDGIASTCKRVSGADFGETSADGMFTLSETECLGACVNAPMMQIGDDFFEDLTPENVETILTTLRNGGTATPGPQNGRHGSEPAGGLTSLKDGEDA
jgi:NADH dehydrogenase (ubiquinone) flavoprotein 2